MVLFVERLFSVIFVNKGGVNALLAAWPGGVTENAYGAV
jgi:hypothetical protein